MSSKFEEDQRLFRIINKQTGHRYEIPMLKKSDVDFREKYIMAMRLKEEDLEAFNKMMNWE